MKLQIFSFTETGSHLNKKICCKMEETGYSCEGYAPIKYAEQTGLLATEESISEWVGKNWGRTAFLFIGAAGIAVRMIAPWVKDKFTDSPVLVMDEKGEYIIPLLSGHVGGAVGIARDIAKMTGAVPVITTATDVQGKFAVDVFAVRNHLVISDRRKAKLISAAVLRNEKIAFYSEIPIKMDIPEELLRVDDVSKCSDREVALWGISVKQYVDEEKENVLSLYPKNVIVGIGCRKGISSQVLMEGVECVLDELKLMREQICAFVSINLKKEEPGILEMTSKWDVPFYTFTAEELRTVESVSEGSEFVNKITGVDNVCERAVKYYCPEGKLILGKTKMEKMTVAVGVR